MQPIPNGSFSFPKETDLKKRCQYRFLASLVPNSLWSCSKVPKTLLFWWKVRRSFQPEAGSSPYTSCPVSRATCLPVGSEDQYLLRLEMQLVGSCGWYLFWQHRHLVAVAKANISTEKVGSTIISPDFSGGNALNACVGSRRRRGCLAALPLMMIVLFVLPALARVVWADECFCNCCVAKGSSRAWNASHGICVFLYV